MALTLKTIEGYRLTFRPIYIGPVEKKLQIIGPENDSDPIELVIDLSEEDVDNLRRMI